MKSLQSKSWLVGLVCQVMVVGFSLPAFGQGGDIEGEASVTLNDAFCVAPASRVNKNCPNLAPANKSTGVGKCVKLVQNGSEFYQIQIAECRYDHDASIKEGTACPYGNSGIKPEGDGNDKCYYVNGVSPKNPSIPSGIRNLFLTESLCQDSLQGNQQILDAKCKGLMPKDLMLMRDSKAKISCCEQPSSSSSPASGFSAPSL